MTKDIYKRVGSLLMALSLVITLAGCSKKDKTKINAIEEILSIRSVEKDNWYRKVDETSPFVKIDFDTMMKVKYGLAIDDLKNYDIFALIDKIKSNYDINELYCNLINLDNNGDIAVYQKICENYYDAFNIKKEEKDNKGFTLDVELFFIGLSGISIEKTTLDVNSSNGTTLKDESIMLSSYENANRLGIYNHIDVTTKVSSEEIIIVYNDMNSINKQQLNIHLSSETINENTTYKLKITVDYLQVVHDIPENEYINLKSILAKSILDGDYSRFISDTHNFLLNILNNEKGSDYCNKIIELLNYYYDLNKSYTRVLV